MENPHVFVDNSSPEVVYTGEWTVETTNNTFGGTQSVAKAGETENSMTFRFTGKGAEVFGTLDDELDLQSLMDGSPYTPLSDGDGHPAGRKGVKIYDLGVLSGPHTVILKPLAGKLAFDYLIYTPVGRTDFDGKQLVYDDTNPSFNFSGSWSPREKIDASALPFNDTLTSTTQPGSSFAIDFVGSSIAVYGALNPTPGRLAATFSIDGSTPSPIELVNREEAASDWTLHTLFFRHTFPDANVATPHLLNVTVTETSESQPFQLDYVLTTGNAHTELTQRQFQKTGEEAKRTGLKIGMIVLGIGLALIAWVVWSKWRERRKKAKGLPELNKT